MSTRPYPSYKDSGVEWLGRIPAQWQVKKLKFLAPLLYGDSLTGSGRVDGHVPVFGSNGQVGTHTHSNTLAPALIVGRKGSYGKINYSMDQCFAIDTTYFIDSRSTKEHLRWLFYALPLLRLDTSSQDCGVPGLSREFAHDQLVPTPPGGEQQAIASFLDRETGKIDALMKKKERLIELLQEKRTALISHAVTQGLNPNAPKKDSGIAWLGHIPEHWQVKRMKFVASGPLAYGANESAETNDPNLPRFIRITDIKSDGSLHDDTFRSLPEEVARPFLLKDGDLLLARSGATVGKTFMYRPSWGRACHAGYLIRCRVSPTAAIPEFVSYFATSAQYWGWLSSVFIQATIQNVSAEKYANLWLPIPPLPEQTAISNYIDRETAKLDALMAKVRTAIERLQEYRTALISAAVTGQIDVRGAV